MTPNSVVTRIRFLLAFFILALTVSNLTTIPLQPEIELLARLIGPGTWMERLWSHMAGWIGFVHTGILQTADPLLLEIDRLRVLGVWDRAARYRGRDIRRLERGIAIQVETGR